MTKPVTKKSLLSAPDLASKAVKRKALPEPKSLSSSTKAKLKAEVKLPAFERLVISRRCRSEKVLESGKSTPGASEQNCFYRLIALVKFNRSFTIMHFFN